jgi:FlaA1/EpsC-like NDP-sugar epimerase
MIDIDYSFLLSRPEWTFDEPAINAALAGKRVLVTGAGGSIGSSICSRISRTTAAALLAVGHGELAIFNLLRDLSGRPVPVLPRVLDIGSSEMVQAMDAFRPDIVIHTAAYKHVGLMEACPRTALRNNAEKSFYVASLAANAGAKRFIFISTDKAVAPTTVMGASKRFAEVGLLVDPKLPTTVCRFGNVLGSSGSLVEILEKRKRAGLPFRLTSKNQRRFWITAHEAVGLVLSSGLLFGDGMFTLEMGKSVPIEDTARHLDPDAIIEWGCALPSEKPDEDLIGPGETKSCTSHPGIYRLSNLSLCRSHFFTALTNVYSQPSDTVGLAREL